MFVKHSLKKSIWIYHKNHAMHCSLEVPKQHQSLQWAQCICSSYEKKCRTFFFRTKTTSNTFSEAFEECFQLPKWSSASSTPRKETSPCIHMWLKMPASQFHEMCINGKCIDRILNAIFRVHSHKIYQHLSLSIHLFNNTLTTSVSLTT